MLSKQDAINKVKLFLNEIINSGIPLDKVILFGSYAKGQQKEFSDIDVVLVSPMFSGFGFEDRKLFSRINIRDEFVEIEVRTYPTEYYKGGDPFISEINKSGIELYNSAKIMDIDSLD